MLALLNTLSAVRDTKIPKTAKQRIAKQAEKPAREPVTVKLNRKEEPRKKEKKNKKYLSTPYANVLPHPITTSIKRLCNGYQKRVYGERKRGRRGSMSLEPIKFSGGGRGKEHQKGVKDIREGVRGSARYMLRLNWSITLFPQVDTVKIRHVG